MLVAQCSLLLVIGIPVGKVIGIPPGIVIGIPCNSVSNVGTLGGIA